MQAGEDEEAAAAAEDSEQHSSESDLTPSGRFQQQEEVSATGLASAMDLPAILVQSPQHTVSAPSHSASARSAVACPTAEALLVPTGLDLSLSNRLLMCFLYCRHRQAT